MQRAPHHIIAAFWVNPFHGTFILSRDWQEATLPPVSLGESGKISRLARMEATIWGRYCGYFFENKQPVFVLWPELYPNYDWRNDPPRVAGSFNHWKPDARWEMTPEEWKNGTVLIFRANANENWVGPLGTNFKFITRGGTWLEVPNQAHNRHFDGCGNFNYHLNPEQTGRHVFQFQTETAVELAAHRTLIWTEKNNPHHVEIRDGHFLLQRVSSRELGAKIIGGKTRFRVFAPRASGVIVETWPPENDTAEKHVRKPLKPFEDGVWEVTVPQACHLWRYQFFVSGDNTDDSTNFDDAAPILDPYALAAMTPAGPGIVIDETKIPRPDFTYKTPAPCDLIVVEAHVRDLVARIPGVKKNCGFRELADWIRTPECYLRKLGITALELQPVNEFGASCARENCPPEKAWAFNDTDYHWGYMPTNYFSPASTFANDTARASQIHDFQELVKACHDAGIAVILDVVYNHAGMPNHLSRLDKNYFFETNHTGELTNWSGCGNDLRAVAPMARRLICDSLKHWLTAFGVDGFRFDLAELLGVPVLHEIECELRALKPDVILIAEPWSFRGHIGRALTHTGYISWNDGFREFLPNYVHGTADTNGMKFFLAGAINSPQMTPTHTLNYTESHDDMCWLDRITENPSNIGTTPTENDARRTRLMGAILLASLGIPMLAAGQDFLRSKHGHKNTFLRGDINALDYERLEKFAGTHAYFRDWIAFRKSDTGAILRFSKTPPADFFQFFQGEQNNAIAAFYNASGAIPAPQIFLAINPHSFAIELPVPFLDEKKFRQIANGDRFFKDDFPANEILVWQDGKLALPALSLGLWIPA